MGKKFKKTKENRKSTIYENDDYHVKLSEGGFVIKKNDILKPWHNGDEAEEEYFFAPMNIMEVTNKKTGKRSQKRCYQPNPISDLEDDLEVKTRFKDIFSKIDK